MNQNQPHEPETKGFNKTRDFQDTLIRLIKQGVQTKIEAAPFLVDWFLNAAPSNQQQEFMAWAAGRLWDMAEGKIERHNGTYVAPPPSQQSRTKRVLSEEKIKEVEKEIAESLDQKWLNAIIPMTGAQVRAAKALPDHMSDQVADDQRVGDVFTSDQLLAVRT